MFRILSLLLVTVSALISGCATCSTPYDCHYAAYGGSNPRGDRVHGRVGSAFRDAAVSIAPEEIFEGQVLEGEIFQGEIGQSEIFQGEIIDGGNGEIIQGDVIEGYPSETYDSSGISEAPLVELPSTGNEFVPEAPSLELPDAVDDAIGNTLNPNPVGAPDVPSELPFGSPTALPPGETRLPNLDRVFDGLPPERHEATIEVLPSVIDSSIR